MLSYLPCHIYGESTFPDTGKTIRKFSPLRAEGKECCQLFPKGSFRMAYKRGHKNLKEIVATSRILIQDNQLGRNSRVGQCRKCNKCGEIQRDVRGPMV